MKGLDIYKTKDGFAVARLHYTADPEKSTSEWLQATKEGYPGGLTGAAWRKEMEIDFTAYSGQLLCYQFIQRHRHKIVKERNFEICNRYGSFDWGRNNPSSFHIYAVDQHKHIHSEYEIYLRDTSIPDFSRLMKDAPHYKELMWTSADPSIWNKNQETKQGLRSLENMFYDEGIYLTKGRSKDDTLAINELLDRWGKLDTEEPRFTISPRCPKQVWEFERLRYRELTTAMVEKANHYEQLVDKDNHSWDDFKYFISTWLTKATEVPKSKIEKGSVAYYQKMDELAVEDWREKYN